MMKRIIFFVCLLMFVMPLSSLAEEMLLEDKCEVEAAGVKVMEGSVDKTSFYRVEGSDLGFLPYETSDDFVYELDIRFNNEGCGFSFMKKGKWNSCIRVKDGWFALQTGGNNFTKYCELDLSAWYHFTFIGRTNKDANAVTYGHIVLEKYDENGNKVDRQVFLNVNLRNNAATHYINAFGNCDIDNLKAYVPDVTALEMTSDAESVTSGGSVQFDVKRFWNEFEMHGIDTKDIVFEVTDGAGADVEGIEIDPYGKMVVDPLYPGGDCVVSAKSLKAGLGAKKSVKITTSDIFTITQMGVNREKTKVTAVSFVKNFAQYRDSVTFVVVFCDESGKTLKVDFKSFNAKNMPEGEGKVKLSSPIPEGAVIAKTRIFAVSGIAGVDAGAIVRTDKLPVSKGKVSIITLKEGSDVTKIAPEDILFFDVMGAEELAALSVAPGSYVMANDTLYEIVK